MESARGVVEDVFRSVSDMKRRIVAIVFDGFLLLDLAGPVGAFEVANRYANDDYVVDLVSLRGGMVRSSSGINVATTRFEEGVAVDLVMVPGGPGIHEAAAHDDVVALLRQVSGQAQRTASICSGAFLLAAAGLLDGRRATTHWGEATQLRKEFPQIFVEDDCIFIEDDRVWSSAGITAGIDLALALVEKDHGFAVAQRVAQGLVVHFRRAGGQRQFSAMLEIQGPEGRFGPLIQWAQERLHERLDVDRLAAQCGLSPRQFSRAFSKATGTSPAKAIEKMRVDSARADIAKAQENLETVAQRRGFGTAARMRRSFIRVFGGFPRAVP